MSFDKTQIIVQTLEGQLQDLTKRSEAALLEVPEHEGAAKACELMAQQCLGFADMIEDKLAKEEASDETKQLVRVYCKNLIVRLHNLCDSNAKNQRNLVLVTKGRLKELDTQATVLTKTIASHQTFSENRERRDREAREALEAGRVTASDEPIIQPPEILPLKGTKLPGEKKRQAAGAHPPGPESKKEDPSTPLEETTKPDTPKALAEAARTSERTPAPEPDEDAPTPPLKVVEVIEDVLPNAKPGDVKVEPIPNANPDDVEIRPLPHAKPSKANRRNLSRGRKKKS